MVWRVVGERNALQVSLLAGVAPAVCVGVRAMAGAAARSRGVAAAGLKALAGLYLRVRHSRTVSS